MRARPSCRGLPTPCLPLFPLHFAATLLQQVLSPASWNVGPDAPQRLQRVGAVRGVRLDPPHPHLGTVRLESNLVPWPDPKLISDRLRDYDLPFRPHLVS